MVFLSCSTTMTVFLNRKMHISEGKPTMGYFVSAANASLSSKQSSHFFLLLFLPAHQER